MSRSSPAFTLIELLIVIAIIAVLSVVVILTLNPVELLKQARDANRISDMATLTTAVNLFLTDTGGSASLGLASTSYISITDPTATSTTGNQCQGLNLPALSTSTGQNWQCAASSTARKNDGTGWLPLNFSTLSTGSPLGQLPQDPINQTSSGLFYSYSAQGTQYAVAAIMESSKYKQQYGTNPPTPLFPEAVIKGNNPSVSVLFSPTGLVGYWPMDEGAGSTTVDKSGSGNNGTWSGTPAGTSGYYSAGKVGTWGGSFDGTSTRASLGATTPILFPMANASRTLTVWIKTSQSSGGFGIINYGNGGTGYDNILYIVTPGYASFKQQGGANRIDGGTTIVNDNNWHFIVFTYDGSNQVLYVDGVLVNSRSGAILNTTSGSNNYFGDSGYGYFQGLIDDVRIYNRTLPPAEIQALYNAEK